MKLNKIPYNTIEVFSPLGESLGFANSLEFVDLRIQIAENKVDGYYVFNSDKKVFLQTDGELSESLDGIFSQALDLVMRLRNMQTENV